MKSATMVGTVSGANVGGYVIRTKQNSFTIDGTPVFTVLSADSVANWVPTGQGAIYHAPTYRSSWSPTVGGTPEAFTNLAGTFSVEAVLNKGEALPLTDAVLATIALIFGEDRRVTATFAVATSGNGLRFRAQAIFVRSKSAAD